MAKISFNKLGLKKNTEVKVINIGDVEVEVKQYLPIEEKMDFIELISQSALEFNFINPIKVEKYFDLYFIYKYTNISFTDKQKEDEDTLYDLLETNGVIDTVIQASYTDYALLLSKCTEYLEELQKQKNSIYGVLSQVVNDIPEALGSAMDAISGLDLEKISETIKIVNETGGDSNSLREAIIGQ